MQQSSSWCESSEDFSEVNLSPMDSPAGQTSWTSSTYLSASPTLSESESEEVEILATSLRFRNMRKFDQQVNGELTRLEKWRFFGFALAMLVSAPVLFWLLDDALPDEGFCGERAKNCPKRNIVANVLLLVVLFVSLGMSAGTVAVKFFERVNVGYTRKTLHFASFFLPFLVNEIVAVPSHFSITLLKFWLIQLVYLLATKPSRWVLWPALIMFRAIDRPSDRPKTLKWMDIQFLASSLVVLVLKALWDKWKVESDHLLLILILVNGLGDGLAEPVGVKWGGRVYVKLCHGFHKYRARTLTCRYEKGAWYKGRPALTDEFERSWEGSTAVYVVSLVSVIGFYSSFSAVQLGVTALLFPPLMAVTEAFSPHTLDSPFLFAIGGIFLSVIQLI